MRRNMGSVISFFRVVRPGMSPVARSTGTRTAKATARPTSLAISQTQFNILLSLTFYSV